MKNGWILFAAALSTLSALALARLSFGLIQPSMRLDMGLAPEDPGYLGAINSLGYISCLLLAGATADRRGGRFCVLLGLTVITAGCSVMAWAPSFALLALGMVLMGMGTAFVYTPLISLTVAWFPGQRGMAIGIANAGIGVGASVVALVLPRVLSAENEANWRWVWASFALFVALNLAMAFLKLHNPAKPSNRDAQAVPSDWSGVLQSTGVRFYAAIYGLVGLCYMVQSIFSYSYALSIGVEAADAGFLLALMGMLTVISGPIVGRLSDRLGRGLTLSISAGLMTVAMIAPVIWSNYAGFALHFVMSGVLLVGLFSTILAGASEHVPPQWVPRAVSGVTLVFAVGQIVGPALSGWLIEWTGRYPPAYVAVSVVMALVMCVSLALYRYEQQLRSAD